MLFDPEAEYHYVDQSILELTDSACLCLQSVRVKDMPCHAWFVDLLFELTVPSSGTFEV